MSSAGATQFGWVRPEQVSAAGMVPRTIAVSSRQRDNHLRPIHCEGSTWNRWRPEDRKRPVNRAARLEAQRKWTEARARCDGRHVVLGIFAPAYRLRPPRSA